MENKHAALRDEFIKKANLKHNNKYDYIKVDYVNSFAKVTIICIEHGDFLQTPNVHLSNHGCPKCGAYNRIKSNTKNKDKFVLKAIIKHGDKYDYSKVVYVKSKLEVTIMCRIHGEFRQQPRSHLQGDSCIKCSKYSQNTTERFIAKSIANHGNKYDYSKSTYIDQYTKVLIICNKHGNFYQLARDHSTGSGCRKCADLYTSAFQRDSKDIFEQKARIIHGDKYDYNEVVYTTSREYVNIRCNYHGIFSQFPTNHIKGSGCPLCKTSHGEISIANVFKILGIEFVQQTRFLGCKSKKLLPFDFYIPEYNLLIEFDGKQHFEVVTCWGGKDGLAKRIRHDIIKDYWCINNDKVILRISHKDIDNIAEIIKLAIEHVKIAGEEVQYGGYILATSFYDSICITKNPNGVRDTSHYITIA